MGLGRQQVTKDEKRIENSVGCSLIAYLLILKLQYKDIPENKSWSIFSLRENFRHRVYQFQAVHDYKLEIKNAE